MTIGTDRNKTLNSRMLLAFYGGTFHSEQDSYECTIQNIHGIGLGCTKSGYLYPLDKSYPADKMYSNQYVLSTG